ncbi:helix-turn-helix domain-containing protein [Kitasatospora sp. NPDC049285]|uniref:helix-turn-helix domain-containing protein n=1 Tax=Kitasatospora sp. NPDC049285 TaxID=3157096 RepID=UPI00342DAB88
MSSTYRHPLLAIGLPALPVPSACPITLTASEWERLKKMAYGHRTEHRIRQRAHVVLHAARGRSNARIARETGLHLDTVRTWRGRFAASRRPALGDLKRSGRPASFTPLQAAQVKAFACQLPAESGTPLARCGADQPARCASTHRPSCSRSNTFASGIAAQSTRPSDSNYQGPSGGVRALPGDWPGRAPPRVELFQRAPPLRGERTRLVRRHLGLRLQGGEPVPEPVAADRRRASAVIDRPCSVAQTRAHDRPASNRASDSGDTRPRRIAPPGCRSPWPKAASAGKSRPVTCEHCTPIPLPDPAATAPSPRLDA